MRAACSAARAAITLACACFNAEVASSASCLLAASMLTSARVRSAFGCADSTLASAWASWPRAVSKAAWYGAGSTGYSSWPALTCWPSRTSTAAITSAAGAGTVTRSHSSVPSAVGGAWPQPASRARPTSPNPRIPLPMTIPSSDGATVPSAPCTRDDADPPWRFFHHALTGLVPGCGKAAGGWPDCSPGNGTCAGGRMDRAVG
ncbi:hypothetical protein G6F50_014723 [Rhizopus delemar]|uniref:Secreted protein n=1 Tax=Rhizopus delemar TaxID=936053 RepID=A0A9P7C651_9FUNG|nr:hypothetical protein G6F50_014723 [Rhizopus delemar]